jgi:heme exporter protein D
MSLCSLIELLMEPVENQRTVENDSIRERRYVASVQGFIFV